jgi:3-oxoacyl-[acyl-carrier-protein] synthase-1
VFEGRAVFLSGAALHSCQGSNLKQALVSLGQPLSAPSVITTSITGDLSKAEDHIPYRFLQGEAINSPAEDLRLRSEKVIFETVDQSLSRISLSAQEKSRSGIFLGSSSFLIGAVEQDFRRELEKNHQQAFPLKEIFFGRLCERLAERYALSGGCYTFNTACTASANALLHAARMLQLGWLDHALVVGTELFNETTLLGFNNLELLTRGEMRPFDQRRNGLQLGEACAAAFLSIDPDKGEDSNAVFRVKGGANLCDPHSISAANPDGSTVCEVMQKACVLAGVDQGSILAVKTHGTASLMNDEAEARGLHRFFSAIKKNIPPLCVLKPYLGHTLGACGLSELLLFCESLRQGLLPGTADFLADETLGIHLDRNQESPGPGVYMLNYFGFGGNNTSLLLELIQDGA